MSPCLFRRGFFRPFDLFFLTGDGMVDTMINSGQGTINVLPIDETDGAKVENILRANETLTYKGVTITVKVSDDNGDEVVYVKTI